MRVHRQHLDHIHTNSKRKKLKHLSSIIHPRAQLRRNLPGLVALAGAGTVRVITAGATLTLPLVPRAPPRLDDAICAEPLETGEPLIAGDPRAEVVPPRVNIGVAPRPRERARLKSALVVTPRPRDTTEPLKEETLRFPRSENTN
jgi:hypothetical protein